MQMGERLHAKRVATEEHVRRLEEEGRVGRRYTATMPDAAFMALGLVSDVGWIVQLVRSGVRLAASGPDALVLVGACFVVVGVAVTVYLGVVHEKEIALRWQKDASFGLVALGGLLGVAAGVLAGDAALAVGGALNAAGSLPIYLSFREGVTYGVR